MTDPNRLIEQLLPRVPGLVLFARQWVDPQAAQDAVQESLIALISHRASVDDPLAWMYRAVRNAAIDQARASARRRRRERQVAEIRGEWFVAPADAMLDAQSAQNALQRLPAEFREIVLMRIWGDLGYSQIASVLRISVSTAHQRYARALRQMRHELENPCSKTRS